MELQDLKRWHWMLIGLVVGVLWAASRWFYGPDIEGHSLDSSFEHLLLTNDKRVASLGSDEGYVYLGKFRISPPFEDATPDGRRTAATQPADRPRVQWITGLVYHDKIDDPKHWLKSTHTRYTEPFCFKASVPYTPMVGNNFIQQDQHVLKSLMDLGIGFYPLPKPVAGYVKPAPQSFPTIQAYFDELNRKYGSGTVPYVYAWWESYWMVMTIYPLGGLLLIGGVWPTVLGLLVGAGFGTKKTKDTYDLDRFKGTSKSPVRKIATVSEADKLQLAAVEAELEKNLEGFTQPATVARQAVAAAELRKLDGGPLEEKKAEEKSSAPKTFGAAGGNVYPTEIHAEKKSSE